MVGISVIVIACPCALALATPIATVIGVSMGAKKGILFKEAQYLESMSQTSRVFLDKTGTITEGRPSVTKMESFDSYDATLIRSLVQHSIHPVAKGIQAYYDDQPTVALEETKVIAAKGIKALYKGKKLLGGNALFLEEEGVVLPAFVSDRTMFLVAYDGNLMAYYELDDTIKEGLVAFIVYLKKQSIKVAMLTGDHPRSALNIANKVGIDEVYAGLLPEGKAHFVQQAHENGETVLMVGDGVNDILALAHADIAIAMGKGAEVAVNASDVILLHDDIKSLQETFIIAKKSMRLVKQNLGISLVYNVITIPLAMAGLIIPLIAALSMSLSSLIVVGNSLRVKWMKG